MALTFNNNNNNNSLFFQSHIYTETYEQGQSKIHLKYNSPGWTPENQYWLSKLVTYATHTQTYYFFTWYNVNEKTCYTHLNYLCIHHKQKQNKTKMTWFTIFIKSSFYNMIYATLWVLWEGPVSKTPLWESGYSNFHPVTETRILHTVHFVAIKVFRIVEVRSSLMKKLN